MTGRSPAGEDVAMRAVVQRVSRASVTVDGEVVGAIEGPGLVVLLGVTHDDTPEKAAALAAKIWTLRILHDERSAADEQAPILAVSQFTLYADTRKGRRPSFTEAALPNIAEPLVDRFVQLLRSHEVPTQTGQFGAHMAVEIHNDGPVTIWLER